MTCRSRNRDSYGDSALWSAHDKPRLSAFAPGRRGLITASISEVLASPRWRTQSSKTTRSMSDSQRAHPNSVSGTDAHRSPSIGSKGIGRVCLLVTTPRLIGRGSSSPRARNIGDCEGIGGNHQPRTWAEVRAVKHPPLVSSNCQAWREATSSSPRSARRWIPKPSATYDVRLGHPRSASGGMVDGSESFRQWGFATQTDQSCGDGP